MGEGSRRPEWPRILFLILLAGAIHGWLITHTEVLARDGVGFIRYAWRLQHEPWGEVLRTSHQHPGYPLAIAVASEPVGWFGTRSSCDQMTLAAQLVNLLAGCLLAVAMYLLGKELFNRRVGFWTAALFQCLPVVARVTSDALSETTFLLTATVTLLLAVRSLRDYSVWRLALCGACGGCCYLIRPEGAVTVVAVATVLVGMQALSRWRRSWRIMLPAVGSLAASAAIVAAPYVAVIGHFTNKPTGQAVMEVAELGVRGQESGVRGQESGVRCQAWGDRSKRSGVSAQFCLIPDSGYLTPGLWAVWWHADGENDWLERLTWGPWAVAKEVVRGFGYFLWLPAGLGLWWFHRTWRTRPHIWILTLLCVFQTLLLCRVALVVGYVSERHVLIIVLCGLYAAVWAILQMPRRWGWTRKKLRTEDRESEMDGLRFAPGECAERECDNHRTSILRARNVNDTARSSIISSAMMVAFTLACLPMTLQPLHANQVGHRQAGLWLAQHSRPSDTIVDPFNWAYFYAGRVFEEGSNPPALPDHQATRYVVLELTVYDWQPNQHQLKHKAQEVQIFAVPVGSQ